MSLPEMIVIGPAHVFNACLVCNLTKDLINVVFPDPRGPQTTITVGATPLSLRIVAATSFRWDRSAFRCKERLLLPRFATPKARVLCFPLCWPPARKRSAAFLVVWAKPSFRGLCLALLWSAMILYCSDAVCVMDASGSAATRPSRCDALFEPCDARSTRCVTRRAVARSAGDSDALCSAVLRPAMKLLQRSDAPAAALFERWLACSDAGKCREPISPVSVALGLAPPIDVASGM